MNGTYLLLLFLDPPRPSSADLTRPPRLWIEDAPCHQLLVHEVAVYRHGQNEGQRSTLLMA